MAQFVRFLDNRNKLTAGRLGPKLRYNLPRSHILLHSTGRGDLWVQLGPGPKIPCLTGIAFLEARSSARVKRGAFLGNKGGEQFNMMISLFDDPMILGNGKWWFLYFSIWTWWFLHWFRSKKPAKPPANLLFYPLRTSAERIYTEPPATTRLANSCGSSGLHTWFDLKMGYTFPEMASWVEDNENNMKINHENWAYLETSPNTSNACSPEPEFMHQYSSLPRLKGIRVLRVATHCAKKGTKCEWCQ